MPERSDLSYFVTFTLKTSINISLFYYSEASVIKQKLKRLAFNSHNLSYIALGIGLIK